MDYDPSLANRLLHQATIGRDLSSAGYSTIGLLTEGMFAGFWWLVLLLLICATIGCRTKASIYAWRPAKHQTVPYTRLALAPVSADPELASWVEAAMFAQRPAVRSDVAMLSAEQLVQVSPVRLASTGPLRNDLIARQAAAAAGADLVLCGQVTSSRLDSQADKPLPSKESQNFNQMFFKSLGTKPSKDPGYHLGLSWNVVDVQTGKTICSHHFQIRSKEIAEKYPDLQGMADQPTAQLVTAVARETWKSLAPAVEKDSVRLAAPWFQPGSIRVQRGVRAAKMGQWQSAEYHWQRAADGWLPAPAAHHNLAIAKAAREDFSGAKQELQHATGLLSLRLPPETLVWLERNHRLYHAAHQLDDPPEGWSFDSGQPHPPEMYSVPAIDVARLPWWSDLPLVNSVLR